MEAETITLIKTLMGLRGMTQSELAKKAKVSKSSLSKYFSGESDLRAGAILKISDVLGANLESVIKSEINRSLGQGEAQSVGDDIKHLLEQAHPITRKTIVETIISTFRSEKNPDTRNRITRLKKYKDSIRTVRRLDC